jgi:MoaA/NifB/PqqE/SkfB family radical SAM enzyme
MHFKDRISIINEIVRVNVIGLLPKLLPIIEYSPFSATLQITSKCTSKCKSCNHWKVKEHKELTTEEWKKVIIELKKNNIKSIGFSGGDIILRSDIFELISFCVNKGIHVGTTLNGYTVNESIAKALMKTNVNSISLSLDDLGDKFSKIRNVRNASGKVRQTLKLLRKYNKGRTKISLGMTIMKSTIHSIKDIVNFGIQNNLPIGFSLIHFTHYFTDTHFSREQYQLNKMELNILHKNVSWLSKIRYNYPKIIPNLVVLEYIYKYFQNYHQKQTLCYQTLLDPCIQPNGDVRPCCSMDSVGNVKKQNIKHILRSDRCIDLQKKTLVKNCPGCSCRYSFNLSVSIFAIIREYLLRIGILKFDDL